MNWLDDVLVSRKKSRLSREESLSAKPVRNPRIEWEMVEGPSGDEARLTVPPPKSAWMPVLKLAGGVSAKERRIQLDELGTFVWTRCDGERTVQDLADDLAEKYRLSYRESVVSLTTYLRQLGRRGLVAFAVETKPRESSAELAEVAAVESEKNAG